MNYLETGLPHTDLYRKKSEFVPPRYKPLCNLGRRYLGLEPVSKRELDLFTNRLCQPKKAAEPRIRSKPSREGRPVPPGSGRFNGGKRMNGNQITNMIDRLTQRKTEPKTNDTDKKKKGAKLRVQFKDEPETDEEADEEEENKASHDAKEESKDMQASKNTCDIRKHSKDISELRDSKRHSIDSHGREDSTEEINRRDSNASLTTTEEKMVQFFNPNDERNNSDHDAFSTKLDRYNTRVLLIGNTPPAPEKKHKQKKPESPRYESLYYRGVKTEIARKFYNETYKRSSVDTTKTPRRDSIKSAKTDLITSPCHSAKSDDPQSRGYRLRAKTT